MLLPVLVCTEAAAAVSARLERNQIATGQTVELVIEMTGGNAEPGAVPDLSALETDFRIIGRGVRESQSTINGRRSVRRELRLTLMPLRSGVLAVPAIRVGDASSAPLSLTVAGSTHPSSRLLPGPAVTEPPAEERPNTLANKPEGHSAILVEAEVTPVRARVGEQVLLIVRVLAANGTPGGRLHDPEPAATRVLALGEERGNERRQGVEYGVYERRYALFPGAAGPLRIDPIQFDTWDPDRGQVEHAHSRPLAIQVAPVPSNTKERDWLPARSVTLSEAGPSEVRIAPGQSVERVITLRAEGIMAEDLPDLPLQIPFQLRVRDDAPRLWNEHQPDGVIGYRTERILLSAEEDGELVLPGTRVDWWNTTTGRWEQAQLPDWHLSVAPLLSADRRAAPSWDRPSFPNVSDPAAPAMREQPPARPGDPGPGPRWAWIVAGTLGLLTIGWWLARRRPRRPTPSPAEVKQPDSKPIEPLLDPTPDPIEAAVTAVEAAYRDGNANAARSALLAWAALIWPSRPPANLARLALQCEEPLRGQITLLEKAFFSPTPVAWHEAPVCRELQAFRPDPRNQPGAA